MKKQCLILCFIILSSIVSAQNIKRYEGKMKMPVDLAQFKGVVTETKHSDLTDITGDGYYDYYENDDEDRVKHGKFYLNFPSRYKINGTYKHGKKDGQWTFESNKEDVNIFLRIISLKVTYKYDILNGPCILVCKFDMGDVYPLCTISCVFKNGIITGEASVVNEVSSLSVNNGNQIISECKGIIDENGLLDGIWNIHDKGGIEITRKQFYYKGTLIYVEEKDFSTGEKTVCYSAFNNLKKAPDIDKIRDTVVLGKKGIVYNGKIAIKDRHIDYPSNVYSYPQIIIDAFPKTVKNSDLIKQQRENWGYAFSQNMYEKQAAEYDNKTHEIKKEEETYKVVEEMPEFPGGTAKMLEYIQKNMKYPMAASESDIQGKVYVQFVVEPDGSLSNVTVLRGIGGGCDEEAVRIVQSMPKFKPGKQRGVPVSVQYMVPIVFKL